MRLRMVHDMTAATQTAAPATPTTGAAPDPADWPEHGTTARYQGNRTGTRPPCKCRRCVAAHTKACAARLLAHSAGLPPRVLTGPVADYVDSLTACGMSFTQISIAAGVGVTTIANAGHRRRPTMHRSVANKILAVRPCIVRDSDLLPVIGTRRRLQALYVCGHASMAIAAVTGVSDATIRNIIHSRTNVVTAAVYKAVRATYPALSTSPGSSGRARDIARRGKWAPAAAWDDDAIDNPAARPDFGESPDRYAAIREDAEWLMVEHGYDREAAARRIGITLRHLERVLAETGAEVAA